jgi:hypothetical protein
VGRRRRGSHEEEARGDGRHRHGDDEPGQPPADLPDQADERHADDPGEGRAEQRECEHPRTVGRSGPVGCRGDRRRVRDADPDSDEDLRERENGEVGSGGTQQRSRSEDRDPAEQELAQADTRGEKTGSKRSCSRAQARGGSELPGGGDRHAQGRRDLRKKRIEHDERRLGRSQRRQESDADRPWA